jgi:uncharacterized protein YbbK (DUF523 family)
MYIISSCLLGNNCKYNGGNNLNEQVQAFCAGHSWFAVCPETAGGLKSPRPPAEHIDGRIVDKEGKDLTEAFQRGARISLELAEAEARRRNETIEGAVLKARSPSCGSGRIYDGTFSGKLVPGDGCLVELLREKEIKVISEKEISIW